MPSTHLNQTTNPLQLLMASMPKKGSGADSDEPNGAEFADLLIPLRADKDGLASNTTATTTGKSPDQAHAVDGTLGKTLIADPAVAGTGPVSAAVATSLLDDDLTAPELKPQLDDQRLGGKPPATNPADNALIQSTARTLVPASSGSAVPGGASPAGNKTASDASPVATVATVATVDSGSNAHSAGQAVSAESRATGSSVSQLQATSPGVAGETLANLPVAGKSAASIQKSPVADGSASTTQQPVVSGTSQTAQRQSVDTTMAPAPVNSQVRIGIKAGPTAHRAAPNASSTGPSPSVEPSVGAAVKASDGNRTKADPVTGKEATIRGNRSAGRASSLAGASSAQRTDTDVIIAAGRGAETSLSGAPAAGSGMHGATVSATAAATTQVTPQSPAPASVEPVNLDPIDASLGEPEFADQLFERLSVMLRGPLGQASIRIHPEELGPIRVELNVDGQQASLRFTAAHAETRAALDASMNDLREQFSQEGLELQDAQVDDEQSSPEDKPGADEQRRPGYAAGQTNQGASTALDSDAGDSTTRVDADTTVRPPTDGRIDLIA